MRPAISAILLVNLAGVMQPLSLTIFNLIVEVGAVQGIVMGLVLYFLPVKDSGKKYLSLILFTLALLNFKILLHTLGLWNLPLFHFLPLAIDTSLPPLIYLYVCATTARDIPGKKILLYFTPTIIFMLYAILIYVCALPINNIDQKDVLSHKAFFNQIKNLEDTVAVITAICYWFFGFKRIFTYRKWLFNTQSDSRLHELNWLKNILTVSAIMILSLIIVVLFQDFFTKGSHSFFILGVFYTYLTVTTYYLSLKGYSLYNLAKPVNLIAARTLTEFADASSGENLLVEPSISDEGKDFLQIKEAILSSLEVEKIYLNPELTLKQLAQHVGYPVATVSATINQYMGLNFRNMVNQYRVKEFKDRSVNPPSHLSLLGIALECGFNSEASFFRIFKQETGLSPNNYIKVNKV